VIISLIWAMSENRAIGIENRLPWRLPADMRWFRQHTLGKPILMGRTTYQSFGNKALPDRPNIILSRDPQFSASDAKVFGSLQHALEYCSQYQEVMVIGGAEVYRQCLPLANRLYMTLVHTQVSADAYFPQLDWRQWELLEQQDHQHDDKHAYDYSFFRYQRLNRV